MIKTSFEQLVPQLVDELHQFGDLSIPLLPEAHGKREEVIALVKNAYREKYGLQAGIQSISTNHQNQLVILFRKGPDNPGYEVDEN